MLSAKQPRRPVLSFVSTAVRSDARRPLALVREIDPTLADCVDSDGRPFASARETPATQCETVLSPTPSPRWADRTVARRSLPPLRSTQ